MNTPTRFIVGLLVAAFMALGILLPNANFLPQKCDCSGGTVFVIDSVQQIQINRTANELLENGDSVSGYLLKRVLMSQQ